MESTIYNGSLPGGVAVDGSGNIYVADQAGNRVWKEAPTGSGYTQTLVVDSLSGPQGIAVDAHGSVYVSDTGNNRVLMEAPSGSAYIETIVATGLSGPVGIAVDGSGNVYIADTGNNQIVKETLSSGTYVQSTLITGLSAPHGLAVDAAGDLYIADENNNRVLKETLENGSYTQSVIGSGFNAPAGIAVAGNGNVYIADTGNNRVVEEVTDSMVISYTGPIAAPTYTQEVAVTGLGSPTGITADGNGNIYIVDSANSSADKLQWPGANFGTVNVGTPSTVSLTFSFDSTGSIGAPAVLTQGNPNLDFVDAGTGSCTTNGTSYVYSAGDSCTVEVTFTPRAAGLHYGAVELEDNSGNVIATAYLQGTGFAPQGSFPPGVVTQFDLPDFPGGILDPVAMDAAGNLYILDVLDVFDTPNSLIKETWNGSGYTASTIASVGGFTGALGLDAAGNVYFSDTYNLYKLTPLASGGYAQSLVNVSGEAEAISADAAGNVYLLGESSVEKLTPSGSSFIGTGLDFPADDTPLAVDTAGNIYVSNQNTNQILKETPTANGYSESVVTTQRNVSSLIVDAMGNIYINLYDSPNNVIKESPSAGGYVQSTVAAPEVQLADSRGNLYWLSDSTLEKLDLVDPPSVVFPSMPSPSTDGPQTVTIANTGNATLDFPVPASGSNPSISQGFIFTGSGTSPCPIVNSGDTSGATLAPGASCQYAVSLASGITQTLSGSLVVTDDSLNATSPSYATQTISLSEQDTQNTPTITWATPAAIPYGTALSSTQLNATASVTGTFAYAPAAGTVFGVGSHSVTAYFTPTDTTDYATATATVTITVYQASPQITWAQPAPIPNGTPLSSTQLDATASVPGTFAYSPAAGTVLTPGPHTVTATFTPTDTTDYATVTAIVTVTVTGGSATPQITWLTPAAITYGTPLSGTQLDATASVAGTFVYAPPAGTILDAGTNAVTATFTPNDTKDYSTATATVIVTVKPARPQITWATPAPITYGTALSASQLNAIATNSGNMSYVPAAGTVLAAGAQTLTATFTPANSTDYVAATANVVLTVNKAMPADALTSSSNPANAGSAVTFTAAVSSSAGTPTGSISFYDETTLLGTGTLSSGKASYTTSALTTGTHSITAAYSGDSNFSAVTSAAVGEVVEDFTIGSSGGGSTSATASPGGQAAYTLALAPPNGGTFASAVTFTVTGLPAGATATFSPASIPAGSTATNVTLTITLPTSAEAIPAKRPWNGTGFPAALGLVLLPILGGRQARRRLNGAFRMLLLISAGIALATAISACGGSANGSSQNNSSQQPQTYNLTVTATSNSLSHTIPLTLTVE